MDWRSSLKLAVVAQVVLVAQLAHATVSSENTIVDQQPTISPMLVSNLTPEMGVKLHRWYSLGKNINLTALEDRQGDSNYNTAGSASIALVQGTEVNIMELSEDGKQALIGIDENISTENPRVDGNEPVLVWVNTTDLVQGQLTEVNIEESEALLEMLGGQEREEFLETDVAARGRGHVRRRGGGRGRGGMTYCLRDVRLTAARFSRRVPQGVPMASIAYPRYRAAGWTPVSYGGAPIGTACFFGGGRRCGRSFCGHAAIKISGNAWKGAGIRPTPFLPNRPGKTYRFQGCLKPPGR